MAGELFGVPVGLRAYQDDQNKLRQLAAQEKTAAAQVGLAEAQIRNYDSDNARADAEAKRKADEAKDAKLLRETLGRIARGEAGVDGAPAVPTLGGGSEFDTLLKRGAAQVDYLMGIGNVDEAAKVLKQLTGGVQDLAQARLHASAAKENEWDAAIKKHDYTSRFLSGVTDQASYDQARMALTSSGVFSPQDLQEMPVKYSPRFVKGAIAGSAAAKQKADLEREASRTATLNAGTRDEIANRKLVRDLEKRRHTLAEQRETRLEKQGVTRLRTTEDKPLSPASARELEIVRSDLKRQGLKVGDAQADLVADIAEQVKTLVDANPGLSRSEATTRVLGEMRERGELEATFFGGNRYKPKEGSVTMPLPTPKTAAELKKGYYYLDAEDGLTKLFDGKGFKVATKRRRNDAVEEE